MVAEKVLSDEASAAKPRVLRYRVPAGRAQSKLVIKASVFIGNVGHGPSAEAALDFVKEVRAAYPDASHHAWAFKITGGPAGVMGSSDDGEPSGTAGRPMLAILEGNGIGEIVIVATRYFGGTKLGLGGLVRAYSGVAREACRLLPTEERVLHRLARIAVSYSVYGELRHLLSRHNVRIEEELFAEKVTLLLAIPYERSGQVADLLLGLTKGQVRLDGSWLEDRHQAIVR